MRPLRYSIDVTLDGCCDHRAMFADEDGAFAFCALDDVEGRSHC
jgi:hypothetical protein